MNNISPTPTAIMYRDIYNWILDPNGIIRPMINEFGDQNNFFLL